MDTNTEIILGVLGFAAATALSTQISAGFMLFAFFIAILTTIFIY